MIKAGIIGTTGYVGVELVRLLSTHPEVEIHTLISRSGAGKKLTDIYPQFNGQVYKLEEYNPDIIKQCDVVFTALPHVISQEMVANVYNLGVKVIDMSGDYRYKNVSIYEEWYGEKHNYSSLSEKAVYGLVELNREKLKSAEIIANPGCYPTSSLLGIIPLVKNQLIKLDKIIIDAKSGVSGAGKSVKESLIFNEVNESIKAYNIGTHRHTSEIENIINQILKQTDKSEVIVSFTPHLVPMKRGILATIYLELKQDKISELGIKKTEIKQYINKLYQEYYCDDSFIHILSSGVPETKYVAGTNNCHLGINYDIRTGRIIIISAIDNMGKGAAGQAIQNMNILYGLPERTGLMQTALIP